LAPLFPLSAALSPPKESAKGPSTAAKYSNGARGGDAQWPSSRRAPSALAVLSRWLPRCRCPSSPQSDYGAGSAYAGGHPWRRAETRRSCGWRARSSSVCRPGDTGLERAVEVVGIDRLTGRSVVMTKLVPYLRPRPQSFSSLSRPSNAGTQISGRGSLASDAAVSVFRRSSWPATRCSCQTIKASRAPRSTSEQARPSISPRRSLRTSIGT
jgi:hypothetical protein